MNRLFGFAGILTTGMAIIWFSVLFCLPWLNLSAPDRRSPEMWTLWAIVVALGGGVIFRFFRFAGAAHWAALRANTPMPPCAWRGILGVYLFMLLAFAGQAFPRAPVDPHTAGVYLYRVLAACSLALAALASIRGFARRPTSAALRNQG